MKPLLILRPEPANSATAVRARAMRLEPVQCPLFSVEAVPWSAPDPTLFDGLILTSANALRLGGRELAKLRGLDVMAVGPATAAAARDAGFRVVMSGKDGVESLLAGVPSSQRLLHLAGADRHPLPADRNVETLTVYRARPLEPRLPDCDAVAMVHSPRAGRRLGEVATSRGRIAIAAISANAASACGEGWGAVEWAERAEDAALLALAARLCQE